MPPRAFQKLNRQPIPGQPPDRGADDAFRRAQIGISEAVKGVEASVAAVAGEIPPYATTAQDVASADSAGSANTVNRGDHAHRGVRSLNKSGAVYGDMIFAGAVSQSGNTFTFLGYSNFPYGTPNRQSANYTATLSDTGIWVRGTGVTITLFAANSVASGYAVYIRNDNGTGTGGSAGQSITVAPAGSDTIDGVSSKTLTAPNTSTMYVGGWFVSDGVSRWSGNYTGG